MVSKFFFFYRPRGKKDTWGSVYFKMVWNHIFQEPIFHFHAYGWKSSIHWIYPHQQLPPGLWNSFRFGNPNLNLHLWLVYTMNMMTRFFLLPSFASTSYQQSPQRKAALRPRWKNIPKAAYPIRGLAFGRVESEPLKNAWWFSRPMVFLHGSGKTCMIFFGVQMKKKHRKFPQEVLYGYGGPQPQIRSYIYI